MDSPYKNTEESEWESITKNLIDDHPLDNTFLKKTVLKSWKRILNTRIGGYKMGVDIFPKPQIMGFFLHELICLEISHLDPDTWGCEKEVFDKDVVNFKNNTYSLEVKTSSNKSRIFGNRSYAQTTKSSKKSKSGYYLAVNFEKFQSKEHVPQIHKIRFGWLDHEDWEGQKSQSGQQAKLSSNVEQYKLLSI